jgi:uncharacterized membrane-anchored protein
VWYSIDKFLLRYTGFALEQWRAALIITFAVVLWILLTINKATEPNVRDLQSTLQAIQTQIAPR